MDSSTLIPVAPNSRSPRTTSGHRRFSYNNLDARLTDKWRNLLWLNPPFASFPFDGDFIKEHQIPIFRGNDSLDKLTSYQYNGRIIKRNGAPFGVNISHLQTRDAISLIKSNCQRIRSILWNDAVRIDANIVAAINECSTRGLIISFMRFRASSRDLARLSTLNSKLVALVFRKGRIASSFRICDTANCSVRYLWIEDTSLDASAIHGIAATQSLQYLHYDSEHSPSEIALNLIGTMSNIRALYFRYPHVLTQKHALIFKKMKMLSALNLVVHGCAQSFIDSISALGNIAALGLSVGDHRIQDLSPLSLLKNLQQLELSGISMNSAAVSGLAALTRINALSFDVDSSTGDWSILVCKNPRLLSLEVRAVEDDSTLSAALKCLSRLRTMSSISLSSRKYIRLSSQTAALVSAIGSFSSLRLRNISFQSALGLSVEPGVNVTAIETYPIDDGNIKGIKISRIGFYAQTVKEAVSLVKQSTALSSFIAIPNVSCGEIQQILSLSKSESISIEAKQATLGKCPLVVSSSLRGLSIEIGFTSGRSDLSLRSGRNLKLLSLIFAKATSSSRLLLNHLQWLQYLVIGADKSNVSFAQTKCSHCLVTEFNSGIYSREDVVKAFDDSSSTHLSLLGEFRGEFHTSSSSGRVFRFLQFLSTKRNLVNDSLVRTIRSNSSGLFVSVSP